MLYFLVMFVISVSFNANADISLPAIGQDSHYLLKKENEIGRKFHQRLEESNQTIKDPLVSFYLNEIVLTLVQALDENKRTYIVDVINDDSINAFAVPGGYIGINAGLIFAAQTESQLAGVLAHEIAHIDYQHIYQLLQKRDEVGNTLLASLLLAIILSQSDVDNSSEAVEALVFGGSATSQQALINFTRENEYEADRKGLKIMQASGYPAIGMAEFFALLGEGEEGELSSIEYLRTHPVSSNRMAEATQFKNNRLVSVVKEGSEYEFFKIYLNSVVNGSYYSFEEESDVKMYQKALMSNMDIGVAIEILKNLHQQSPENLWLAYSLIKKYIAIKNYKQAEKVINKIIKVFPGQPIMQNKKIMVLGLMGKNEEALELALAVLDKDKDNQVVRYMLVNLYKSLRMPLLSKEAEANYLLKQGELGRAIYIFKYLKEKVPNVDRKKIFNEKIKAAEAMKRKN